MSAPAGPQRMSLDDIQDLLGHRFRSETILRAAVTHGSARGSGARESNDRLAFLGDAVVGLVAAEKVFRDHAAGEKGELTKLRQELVKNQTLADLAGRNGLQLGMVVGKGEERDGRDKTSMRAGLIEALIGAVFTDKNYEAARDAVARLQSQGVRPPVHGMVD